jgi:signal transduction histidine kinase
MRDRLRQVLAGMVVAVVGALVVFGLVLASAQNSSRDNIAQRFKERAIASAALTSSLFDSAAGTSQAINVRRYGGKRVSSAPLARRAREANDQYLVVIDQQAQVLAASTGTTASARRQIAARPAYIRNVLAGRAWALSDLLPQAGGPGLVYAQAFPVGTGRRALVAGLDARLISGFLGGSLKQLPSVKGGHTYVLDSHGAIVASPEPGLKVGAQVREPGLLAALGKGGEGTFGSGRHFAADRIKGTPWRVVLTAPESQLFASVRGGHKWGPWALFVAFGLAALAAVFLVSRVIRSAAQVATVNAELEHANAELDARASELGRSNEELERFASVASHDLQEPLRKVQMFSERIVHHDGAQLSGRGRDYLERMNAAARRMQALIDGLLIYSQVAMQDPPLEDVDLNEVAREVVEDLAAVVRETDGTVHIGSLPHVRGDAVQMRQLLQNLVSNGLKFHRTGVPPLVSIEGSEDSGGVHIAVSDNGIGFERRHARRIFDVFERLHPRGEYPGTGIGLALCRRIAERHGGTIETESIPGEGSRFVVTIPARDSRDPSSPSTSDQPGAGLVPS